MLALTRARPPLVEPPSQTSSWFAALESEFTSRRSKRSGRVPSAGLPWRTRKASTAISTLSVEAAGSRACAFQAAPAPSRRSWTKTARARKGNARGHGSCVRVGRPRSWREAGPAARPCAAGRNRADDRRRAAAAAVDSGHRQSDVAPRSATVKSNRCRRTAFSARRRSSMLTRIRRGPGPTLPAEGDLVWTRDDERGRGGRRRASEEEGQRREEAPMRRRRVIVKGSERVRAGIAAPSSPSRIGTCAKLSSTSSSSVGRE